MIYQYIKANPKVAEYLGIATQRLQFPDGNYMLWKFDLLPLGGNNDETIRMIGGVGMDSNQCRNEQRGVTVTPMPEALDERFKIERNGGDTDELTPSEGETTTGGEETEQENEETVSEEGDDHE
jgi:hypothetical protein